MKNFWNDFKAFALKGNVVSMAIGIIIGSAFTAVVNGLVNSIIMPLLSLLTGKMDYTTMVWMIGETEIPYGAFLQAVINFVIIALVLFTVTRAIAKATPKKEEPAPEPAPEPRKCPYCKMEIAEDATRCPHCTSEL